ncbi:hypothetical protein LR48_Vigan10g208200 [Vigna angularis]|uniref:Uncharacterized protein n=1 Tax=Phaseolus angularis TaxID=3914 RepID=A0A0L9VMB0_PHAAN|nr:hypothetical protein LR48_Vigan10g208200 [Vigna angularis]
MQCLDLLATPKVLHFTSPRFAASLTLLQMQHRTPLLNQSPPRLATHGLLALQQLPTSPSHRYGSKNSTPPEFQNQHPLNPMGSSLKRKEDSALHCWCQLGRSSAVPSTPQCQAHYEDDHREDKTDVQGRGTTQGKTKALSKEDARPEKMTLVQERGRSSRRGRTSQERTLVPGRSGRSSSQAEDARSARQAEDTRPSQAEQDARPASREDARPKQTKASTCRNARRQQEYARPGRLEGTLVQKRRENARQRSGRSSRNKRTLVLHAERTLVQMREREDARPRERTFVQDARPRTLVPEAGARPREGDARPEAAGARPRSRRSSSQAEVHARPARKRTFVQNARPEDRTLVQPDTRDARPCRRNERTLVHARGRSSMQEDVRPAEVNVRPLSASREFHARAAWRVYERRRYRREKGEDERANMDEQNMDERPEQGARTSVPMMGEDEQNMDERPERGARTSVPTMGEDERPNMDERPK